MLEIGQDLAGVVNIHGDDFTTVRLPEIDTWGDRTSDVGPETTLVGQAFYQGLGTKVGKFCCRLANQVR